MMKTLITVSALAAALSISSASLAGPGPGLPGPGQRAAEHARAPKKDGQAYALTGGSSRERTTSNRVINRRHDGRTHISHRQFPGDQ